MAFPVSARTTGELITASIWNADIKDNLNDVYSSGRVFVSAALISFGAAVRTQSYVYIAGTFAPADGGVFVAGLHNAPTITGAPGDNAYGAYFGATLNEAASGAPALFAQAAFIGTAIGAGAATAPTAAATLYIDAAMSGATTNWAIWVDDGAVRFDGDIVLGSSVTALRTNTADGADSSHIGVAGGGAGFDRTRGADIVVGGNESASFPGCIDISIGNVASSAFKVRDVAAVIAFQVRGSDGVCIAAAAVLGAAGAVGAPAFSTSGDTNTGIYFSAADTINIATGGVNRFSINSNGVITASSTDINTFNSTYGSDRPWKFLNSHASTPFGLQVQYTGAAPNGTGNQFLYCPDTGGLRAEIRGNGGVANYQANNVNLSDARLKRNLRSVNIAAVWGAHKNMRDAWCLYDFADQTHGDPNAGYTAQGIRKVWANVAPWLVDVFDERRGSLGVYDHDLKNFTGMIVTELQWRSDNHEARIAALEAA